MNPTATVRTAPVAIFQAVLHSISVTKAAAGVCVCAGVDLPDVDYDNLRAALVSNCLR